MSTNYYIVDKGQVRWGDRQKGWDRQDNHVGKSSHGWVFSFQGNHHRTVAAWNHRLDNLANHEILIDEYGVELTVESFWKMLVLDKLGDKKLTTSRSYALEAGFESSQGRSIAWDFLKGIQWEDAGCDFTDREFF